METTLPEVVTDLPEVVTDLPEIKTALPEIEILSYITNINLMKD